MAFTIRDGRLFTLRERELYARHPVLYRMYARPQRAMVDGNTYELLLDLFRNQIEQQRMRSKTFTRSAEN